MVTADDDDRAHWTRIANDWIAWARTPQHDAFWAYRDSLRAFIGRGPGTALDVGCGEGRVSRAMTECGYDVTAIDPVPALVDAAAQARSAAAYAVASATSLPFGDDCFDLVMAYNVLMNVSDMPAAVREIGRVLRPAGELVVSIVHPFADCGRFAAAGPDAAFVVEDTYFGRRRFDTVETRDGLTMHFAGWSQPLEVYAAALAAAGLAITALREPVPDPAQAVGGMARWARMPLFLWLKARRLAT